MSREHLSYEQRVVIDMVDMLNVLAGSPFCNACCEHGGGCTLPTDHDGLHEIAILTGPDQGKVLCTFQMGI